ncbi:MAG: TRZ/ATZ family hydrolase [Gammaproteobacteria bacterium]|nr:TRZ/ATZ family hydrolase [Gammaproteobacteria bacterium]
MASAPLQILSASWIVPVNPDNQVLTDHALVIDGDRIAAIGPREEIVAAYPGVAVVDLADCVLIPGLVNAHTHAAMTLFRGYADDLPLMEWLNHYIWPAEMALTSPEFVRDGTRLAVAEMLGGGTTCFCDMYFFPDVTAAVAVEAGIRAAIGMIAINFASAWATDIDDYLSKGLRVHDQFNDEPLITTLFAPHAPYTVSGEALQRISTLAEELDVPVVTHLHETEHEVTQAMESNGERPIHMLRKAGLLSPRLLAVHMTALHESDIEACAHNGVHVIHCPESNLKLGSGICPVPELLEAGINVALGTDGAASNNDLDMFSEMRTAALLAKGSTGRPTVVPAHTALRMATQNGADALGLGDRIGSLEVGKQADIVAVDLARPATEPVYDPISQLVYAAGRDQVSQVWVAGRQVVVDGSVVTLDIARTLANARMWRQRIADTAQ